MKSPISHPFFFAVFARLFWRLAVAALWIVFTQLQGFAQTPISRETVDSALSQVRQNIVISQEKIASLVREVGDLKKDQKTLTAALVESAAQERAASLSIEKTELKLDILLKQKRDVQHSLRSRRAEFAEVLAALERMGLKPPPAILIHPDDALKSVRSAVLLGAVVPELRDQTLALSANLRDLTQVSQSIEKEYDALTRDRQTQVEQQKKMALLLSEKANLEKQSEGELAQQRQSIEELALKAKSLEDLIAEIDHQEKSLASQLAMQEAQKRLQNVPNFETLQHHLSRPVVGTLISQFRQGRDTSNHGEIIQTAPSASVTSPTDGMVVYAGDFRSYGKVVIIDVGSGYHIVMAGMGQTNVELGQFVLAGEPIGSMGQQIIASALALDIGKSTPMLYIEFRKNGKPVDPALWWGLQLSGRKQNDS